MPYLNFILLTPAYDQPSKRKLTKPSGEPDRNDCSELAAVSSHNRPEEPPES